MSLKEITIVLADWSDYYVFVTVLFSLFTIKVNRFFKLLFWYCLLLMLLQLSTSILAKLNIHNWFVYHILGLVELCITFLLYRELKLKKIWSVVFGIVLALYITDSVYVIVSGLSELNINPTAQVYFTNHIGSSVALLFITILGIDFLWEVYRTETVKNIGTYPYFYISAGMTFYASGAFFMFLLSSNIIDSAIPNYIFLYGWMMVIIFNYLKFSLIIIGIFLAKHGN